MSNLGYLNQARKMLTDDYKNRHTAEYNSWMNNHKNSWMQPHTIMPFPPFVISAAIVPFKPTVSAPSDDEVVAKALELYNLANPPVVAPVASRVVAAPTVQEVMAAPAVEVPAMIEEVMPVPIEAIESITEEVIPESIVEEPIVEESKTKAPVISYTDAIHKIYEIMKKEDTVDEAPKFTSIDATLQTIPQPAEELAKADNSNKILPTMLEKLQSIWATKGGSNV